MAGFCEHCNELLGFLTLEVGPDWLSQNVGKELPQHATCYTRRARISTEIRFEGSSLPGCDAVLLGKWL